MGRYRSHRLMRPQQRRQRLTTLNIAPHDIQAEAAPGAPEYQRGKAKRTAALCQTQWQADIDGMQQAEIGNMGFNKYSRAADTPHPGRRHGHRAAIDKEFHIAQQLHLSRKLHRPA